MHWTILVLWKRRKNIPIYTYGASQVALVVKNPPASAGDTRDMDLTPGLGRSLGESGNPLEFSCLENSIDRGAWQATVHGILKSQTWLKWLSTPLYLNGLNMYRKLQWMLIKLIINPKYMAPKMASTKIFMATRGQIDRNQNCFGKSGRRDCA